MDSGDQSDQSVSDLPEELSNPARDALIQAGYVRLEQVSKLSEAEILKLHGVGPKTIPVLRRALEAFNLSFAEGKRKGNRRER